MNDGTPPSDSKIQKQSESLMMAWLSDELDQKFEPKRYHFADGSRAEVDGVSSDGTILCEA